MLFETRNQLYKRRTAYNAAQSTWWKGSYEGHQLLVSATVAAPEVAEPKEALELLASFLQHSQDVIQEVLPCLQHAL